MSLIRLVGWSVLLACSAALAAAGSPDYLTLATALALMVGLMLTAFGRYSHLLGWHAQEERRLRFFPPGEVSLTPAQRSTAWYFLAVAARRALAPGCGPGKRPRL